MSSKMAEEQDLMSHQAFLDEIRALQAENRALKAEAQSLRTSLEEAQELTRAISEGDLDALVIPGPKGELVFTLDSADNAYRILVETMNEGTATLGFDITILYCNRRLAELLKMPLQTITGTSFHKFIAPEDTAIFKMLLEHGMGSGEVKLQAADGRILPAYLSVSSLKTEGSPNAWCLVVTDLTEQKKNEELIASDRLTRSIIEQSAEIITVCDTSGIITHFSRSMLGIFGFVPTNKSFESFIDLQYSGGPDAGKSILPVSSALKGLSILREEVTFEHRDYKRRYCLLLNSVPLKNSEDEIIGCVMTLTDITKHKRAEKELQLAYEELQVQSEDLEAQTEELRIANEALSESEKRFKILSDANALLLSSKDPKIIIQSIAEKVMHFLNCDVFFNYIFDESREKLHLNAYNGISKEAAEEIEWLDKENGETICACVARDGCRIVAKNTQHNNDQRADLVRSVWVQAYACHPLHSSEKTIGTLSFGTKNRKDFTENELALMKTVSDQLSVAIERKQAEQQLFNVNERLKALMNALPVGVCFSDDSTCQTITGNPAFMAQFDTGPKDNVSASAPDKNAPGRKLRYFQDGQQLRDFDLPLQRAVAENREILPMIIEIEMANGRRWFADVSGAPIHDMHGDVVGGVAVTVDITKRKKAERALKEAYDTLEEKVKERTVKLEEAYKSLKESERNLSEAQKMAHIGNWDLDIKTGEVYWSDETYRIFGLVPQAINLTYDQVLSYVHPGDRNYVINSIGKILDGKLNDIDYRIVLANGEERIANTRLEVIFDERNNPVRLRGTTQDITERNKAEKAVEKINKIRIKEIHHRIKNNLQVISSMLDLQTEKFQNKKVLEAFRESQNRVISMALIHEELYKGDDTDKLNFSVYIKKLVEKLFQTYSVNCEIQLKMDLEENAFMDMDTAIPLGIIVNELFSNSLKHAFYERKEGEIRIGLTRENKAEKFDEISESIFVLTISDDGKGITEDLELENVESLGLQLVNILVDQLDGEIELNRKQGTEFRINFNTKEK